MATTSEPSASYSAEEAMQSSAPPDVVSGAEKEVFDSKKEEWPEPVVGNKEQALEAPRNTKSRPVKRMYTSQVTKIIFSSASESRMKTKSIDCECNPWGDQFCCPPSLSFSTS